MTSAQASELRALLREALPEQTSPFGEPPPLHQLFVPGAHVRALQPNTMLVVGARGEGKSFWWTSLQETGHRALVETLRPESQIGRDTICVAGFGERPNPSRYPSEHELLGLQQDGHEFKDIWRTIVVFAVLSEVAKIVEDEKKMPELQTWRTSGIAQEHQWSTRVHWLTGNPGSVDRLLHESDQELQRAGRYLVILFDALDRCSSDWSSLYNTVRSLLQTTLTLRSTRRIRSKVFLRTDQFNEQRLAGFPDASKLFSSRVELRWSTMELYSLVFQLLANHLTGGHLFRNLAHQHTSVSRKKTLVSVEEQRKIRKSVAEQLAPWKPIHSDDFWPVPTALQYDGKLQARVLHALTGPAMGTDRRRGIPYRWIANHLWDANQRITPRPFLVALRAAAIDTEERHTKHHLALHYKSIKTGIRAASESRLAEIKEDYDWLEALMDPLKGLFVPCGFAEIEAVWEEAGSLARLKSDRERGLYRLPPAYLDEGAAGILKELQELGLFYRMRDGRENMPDVYRLGFGLKRMGGIPPAAGRT